MSKIADWAYNLHVRGTSPRKVPLVVLGEIAQHLADILGSEQYVHLATLKRGSLQLLVRVDEEAIADVHISLSKARLSTGKESSKVVRLNQCLGRFGLKADLETPSGSIVLQFPGIDVVLPGQEKQRTVQQVDHIIGTVIKIGGRDETVPMTLETDEGEIIVVNVKGKSLARTLAQHIYGDPIRISGLATWSSDGNGKWTCVRMNVSDWEPVSSTPLDKLFDELRRIPGNGWNNFDDPLDAMEKFRGDEK